MIKGVKRKGIEYDNIFEPEMGYFLSSITSFINIDEDSTTSLSINYPTDKLKSLLNNEFEKAKNGLRNTLSEIPIKVDKLYLLSDINIEIKSIRRLLEKHTIDENFSQEYCFWINEYLEKMHDFIYSQQEDIRSISQNDFPIPQFNLPDKNASTEQKPLLYFEFLFIQKGISQLRDNFIHYYDRFDFADFTYNKETEIITFNHYDNETGKWSETQMDFNTVFSNRLKSEYYISRKYIDDYIDEQKKESAVTFFINRILSKLNLLLQKIGNNDEALKYGDSARPIHGLIRHIKKTYPEFIHKKNSKEQNISETPKFFKLKGVPAIINSTATDLHNSLFLNNYLNKECKKDFINLFTGKVPENKISWLLQKGELKSFIDFLLSLGKIENCQSRKWQITAANFKFNNVEFTNKQMNGMKKAKNDNTIKQIVQKIN